MFDKDKLDIFFKDITKKEESKSNVELYQKKIRRTKLFLPLIAAFFVGLLLIIPKIQTEIKELSINIKKPDIGTLEKLHVENLEFIITDKDNKISKFYTSNIDETQPQSKLIKLTKPNGVINDSEENWLSIKSEDGLYNQNQNILHLDKKITILTNEGITIETNSSETDFNLGITSGNEKVFGFGDLGEINAENFEIIHDTKTIIFKGKTSITISDEAFKRNKDEK